MNYWGLFDKIKWNNKNKKNNSDKKFNGIVFISDGLLVQIIQCKEQQRQC